MRARRFRSLSLLVILLGVQQAFSIEPLRPVRAAVPPVIDGILDDPVWSSAPMVTGFRTFTPDWGKDQSERTEVMVAYDAEHLYFAYRCHDREPSLIKASVSNRDNIFRDDWICINLDSFGDQQSLYGFYVNPLGIQGDTKATATNEDQNFDAIWESAGRLTDDGYIVEVAIPTKSIRFAEQDIVRMGVIFERRVSRRSEQGTFPALDPAKGNAWLTQMHPLEYEGLTPYTLFEVLPAITFMNRGKRIDGVMRREEQRTDFGLTMKYGITQDLILDATYNPDFSQVEADAGQVDVNLRYQLFFPEKRPFFLEGSEQFMITGTPDLLYTRTIANPIVGAKVTGKLSRKNAIAALFAVDELPPEEQAVAGRSARVGMLRYRYALDDDSFLGAVLAARDVKDGDNALGGFDGMLRISRASTLSIQGLVSTTADPALPQLGRGHKYEVGYDHSDRDLGYGVYAGRLSEDFVARMGYIPRPGLEYYEAYVVPRFYPSTEALRRLSFLARISTGKDLPSGLWERSYDFNTQVLLGGTHNAVIQYGNSTEVFAARVFNVSRIRTAYESQMTSTFFLNASASYGSAIFYSEEPFGGKSRLVSLSARYQPMQNLNAEYAFTYTDFAERMGERPLYAYAINRGKLTYQLNRYLFVRGIAEYNNFRKRLLTDALISFTYIPGTVVYGGYGSVHERIRWEDGRSVPSEEFLQTRRGLFFKASYLWRL